MQTHFVTSPKNKRILTIYLKLWYISLLYLLTPREDFKDEHFEIGKYQNWV